MPEQMTLPGLDVETTMFKLDEVDDPSGMLRGYTLFLALLPSGDDAQRIHQQAASLIGRHGMVGKPLTAGRLHVTLYKIAGFPRAVPQADVDAARAAAAASVACAPFAVVFDQALSFTESDAFVLRSDAGSDAAIAWLRQALKSPLQRAGLHPQPSRTPHMTLVYDSRHHIDEHPIEPIRWVATRLALIISHVGLGHHQHVGEWTLMEQPPSRQTTPQERT